MEGCDTTAVSKSLRTLRDKGECRRKVKAKKKQPQTGLSVVHVRGENGYGKNFVIWGCQENNRGF